MIATVIASSRDSITITINIRNTSIIIIINIFSVLIIIEISHYNWKQDCSEGFQLHSYCCYFHFYYGYYYPITTCYEIPCHLQWKQYIYISLAHSFLVILVSGKVFHISMTRFGISNLLCALWHSYVLWFLNFPWMKNVLFQQWALFGNYSRRFAHCIWQ